MYLSERCNLAAVYPCHTQAAQTLNSINGVSRQITNTPLDNIVEENNKFSVL